MPGKAVGWAAADLPWLCPNTDSLVGLAERPADLARLTASDPALLVFLLRTNPSDPGPDTFTLAGERYLSSAVLDTAAAYLDLTREGWLPPTSTAAQRARSLAQAAAAFARRLAAHTRRATQDAAGALAALAPLGWYAVAAVAPEVAAEALQGPGFATNPTSVQDQLWGLDHDAIARRLAARWRLPGWAGAAIGNLNLPFRIARGLVSEPDLFAIVQLAVCEAEDRTGPLGLTRTADRRELLAHLGLASADIAALCVLPPGGSVSPPIYPENPHTVPLVGNLLRATAAARRRNGAALVVRLESRIDDLHRQLLDLGAATGDRLREAKLAGLAELAAGAGHEINNPLAVISGIAQRLIRTEPDPDRGDSLRLVVRQTHRISDILRDLMHFARPAKPTPTRFTIADLMASVRAEIDPIAAEREARVDVATLPEVWLDADINQLRRAVMAVVRNGVEAAGRGGWVRVSVEAGSSSAQVIVEDSGPGLTREAAEHAFDPFFCGRSAGRGRGLGLPIAWRFTRENGGDIRYEPAANGPTRFVLTVLRAQGSNEWTERECA